MSNNSKFVQVCALVAALLFCTDICSVQAQRRSRRSRHRAAQVKQADEGPELAEGEVRLRLVDGTRIPVDDAWESAQGIWYRNAGITHLVPRDHVKMIERGSAKTPNEPPVAAAPVTNPEPVQTSDSERPAWIFLKGGAKVEADSATESAAGVWYQRGSLSIFIERSRIDHIEREDPESLAKDTSKERGWSTGNHRIDSLIRQSGARYNVDPYLIFCVMEQESHFNSRALSPKGARGLMQLMPGTSARFGVRRPQDPGQNIAGGTRYLRQLLDRFNGRVDLVLASYNAGEGAVIRFGHRVPPYRETRAYVKRISYRYRRSKTPVRSATGSATSAGGT